MRAWLPLVALLLLLPGRAPAQATDPLARFVQTVARLWERGDVDAVLAMADEGPLSFALGAPPEPMDERHAGAALRSLFGGRTTVAVRPLRVTLSGGTPARGFGEFEWLSRPQGAPITQTRSVYVGAVWTPRGWRISELRVMP